MNSPEEHLATLLSVFKEEAAKKYRAGVEEHGPGLWKLSHEELQWQKLFEIVDLVHYQLTDMQNEGLL